MNKFIKTNSSIIYNKFEIIKDISTTSDTNLKCPHCSKKFNQKYYYSNVSLTDLIKSIEFSDLDIHLLLDHNLILNELYEKICKISIETNDIIQFNYDFSLFKTNSIHVLDAVYEEGSKKKYIDVDKNVFNSKINRFSEHYGFVYFDNKKISKVTILDDTRVDKGDPLIFQPVNSVESLKVDYMFHTHPKTPYIGSRVKYGMLYEFPSINDIIHFIDHHNNGRMIGSLVMAPEGIYFIHKYIFSREKIKIDYDLLINELESVFMDCYNDSYQEYEHLDYKKLLVDGWVKIPDEIFFNNISTNFEYINNINKTLVKYDLYIDYFPRIKLPNTNYWVLPDIYLPIL